MDDTPAMRALRSIGVGAVCLGVILGPLFLGATFPWPRLGLEALMTVAILCWIATTRTNWVSMGLPLAIAAVALLQLLPLPDWMLVRMAPISAGAWKVAEPTAWGTIAVDPGTTASGIRRLLLGLATIGAVTAFARSATARRSMLTSIAISCTIVITLAYAFRPDPDNKVILGFIDLAGPIEWWKSPVHSPVQTAGFSESETVTAAGYAWRVDSWGAGDRVGPYIVSNHFAGGVCLMLPVAIALWLWWAHRRLPIAVCLVVAVAMAGFGLHAVAVVAKSRAGTASLVLALSMLATLLATKPLVSRITAGITIAGIVSWIAVVAFMHGPLRGLENFLPEGVRHHVPALTGDGRVWASDLAKRIFAAAPVLGTGFGSYYGLIAYLDARTPPMFFAHNDYAQLLAETGLVGGLIAAVFCARLMIVGYRFYRTAVAPERIRDAGCWAALVGIAAHSAFDWNLHVPANAFLASVVAGLALASAPFRSSLQDRNKRPDRALRPFWKLALCVPYLACLAFLWRDAWSEGAERRMRDALAQTRLAHRTPIAKEDLAHAIAAGHNAFRWDPANARIALLVGQLELCVAAQEAARSPAGPPPQVTNAEEWFSRARRLSASLRGLPEKQPVVKPRP